MQIKKTIPGFFNGVSQQPASTRLDTQCELQENMIGTLVDGLIRRPNSEYVAKLTSNATINSFVHKIDRDVNEKYILIITGNATNPIEIFKPDGTVCAVNYTADAKTYFVSNAPQSHFKAVTIADYTIVANKTKLCSMTPSSPSSAIVEYYVFVKRGIISTNYQIIKKDTLGNDTTVASYTTSTTETNTDTIAAALATALTTALPTWTVTVKDSTIKVVTSVDNPGSLRAKDGWGDQALVCTPKQVQSFTDLWPMPFKNVIFTITGTAENNFGRYYVKSTDKGTWAETLAEGMDTTINKTTMPHKIVRTDTDTFAVSAIDWSPRTIGDTNSAPDPSFIGDYIRDVFFFQNRLGFLSGENVIMSRASDFFNFFPTTAMDVLDDDPIDESAAGGSEVNILDSASAFNENLLLDSNQQQFILTAGSNLLTPKTSLIKPVTRYNTSPNCKPTAAGTNLYYIVPVDNYSRVKEYYVSTDTYLTDAADITDHIDKYLPANITTLVTNTPTNMLFAYSTDSPKTLYHYSYLWQTNQKIQSAWDKWTFDDNILGITSLDTFLYLLIQKGTAGDICLVKINLADVTTGDLSFRVYLDKLVSIQGTYSSETNKTTWTIPYSDVSDKFIFVDETTGMQLVTVTQVDGTSFEATGNYTSHKYLIGKTLTGRHRFSEWFVKDSNGIADLEGRLHIKKLLLQFVKTGPFKIEVTPYRRDTVTHDYSGMVLGTTYFDSPSLTSKTESFLMMCNARNSVIDIVCDSYLPVQFILAEFLGDYVSHARAI